MCSGIGYVNAADLGVGSHSYTLKPGGDHSCALLDGGARCWGRNDRGQLGDGSLSNRAEPGDVVGLGFGIKRISAGANHTCALTVAGGLRCWGENYNWQLGADTSSNTQATPVDVTELTTSVIDVAAGDVHTCALTEAGGVKCWGSNWYGQLGNDAWGSVRDVTGLTSGVKAIVVGSEMSCALTSSGGVKCWGRNDLGQLGDGTNTTRRAPVDVLGLTSQIRAIASGNSFVCALTDSGELKCWGSNQRGQLGNGTWKDSNEPVKVTGFDAPIEVFSLGNGFTCAGASGKIVDCWGANELRQALQPSMFSLRAELLEAGAAHACALSSSGAVKCWGSNVFGQIGVPAYTNWSTPILVIGR